MADSAMQCIEYEESAEMLLVAGGVDGRISVIGKVVIVVSP